MIKLPQPTSLAHGLRHGLKSAVRIGDTLKTLSFRGLKWSLGDRPPMPQLLRQTFEELGTTYIKLGQFIASSPSLFPDAYVEEFQKCLDKTTPLPFHVMKRVLEQDLGKPADEVFSTIDPEPLASASIAQVYGAKLLSGEDVVIKIQKPGVHNILLTDLNFLYVSAKILEKLVPNLSMASLSDIVEEIQKGMLEECDFLQEAKNIEAFQLFLSETGNTQAVAPTVYEKASHLRVLTMERFYGVPFTGLDSVKGFTDNPEATLIAAMNTWFASLMFCECFHADVHAGNLLVLRDGRVAFIDFGIVGRIKPSTWESVSNFITAVTQEDYQLMASSMLGIGMTDHDVDTDDLARDIRKLYTSINEFEPQFDPHHQENNEQDINRLMIELVSVGKRHGIKFPREFALLLKQLLYFDRYVKVLAENADFYMDERLNFSPDKKNWSFIH